MKTTDYGERQPVAEAAGHRGVDPALLRAVFGTFATGVTVLTLGGPSPHGMTANSFTSVSLDPPLVLLCVGRRSRTHGILVCAETFAVSVLAAGQEAIARRFADPDRPVGMAQFEDVEHVRGRVSGAPLIMGALAWLECRMWRVDEAGDHSIFLGQLLSVELTGSSPLVRSGRRYIGTG